MIYKVFVLSLLGTCALEGGLMAAIYRRRDFVYYSFLCNLLTNPALNLLLMMAVRILGPAAWWPALLPLELAAVGVEAHVLRLLCGFSLKRALLLSLLLNGASFLLGLWVQG